MPTQKHQKQTKPLATIHSWWRNRSRLQTYTLYSILTLLILFFTAPLWNPIIFPPVKDPQYGVSFSAKRARELSIDGRANLTALLDDMAIRHYRLMSYWDEHEKTRGQFDFTELDWQMNEITKRGGDVTLSIGLRQPRWPECHAPKWSFALSGNEWKQALYAYMEIVVQRYENHPALKSWQLENEALNAWFGACETPDSTRLNEEFDLLRRLTKKPIWMSLSDQHGLPVNPPNPDRYGYSVYRIVWNDKTPPFNGYITYPTPIWYHRLRAQIIQHTKGRDIFIHELQLEPWGPIDTLHLTPEEQDKSMSIEHIRKNLYFAREIGANDIYTWGGEWWYWRKVHGDPSIWDAVKRELQAAAQP